MERLIQLIEPAIKALFMLLMIYYVLPGRYSKRMTGIAAVGYGLFLGALSHILTNNISALSNFYSFVLLLLAGAVIWCKIFIKAPGWLIASYLLFYINCISFSNVFTRTMFMLLLKEDITLLSILFSAPLLMWTNWFFSRYKINLQSHLSRMQYQIMIAAPVIVFASFDQWRTLAINNSEKMLLVILCFYSTNLLLFYLLSSIMRDYDERMFLNLSNKQLELQIKELENNNRLVEQMRTNRHEFKNRCFHMNMLLKKQDYEGLNQYLSELSMSVSGSAEEVRTGNACADMILTQKVNEAKKRNLPFALDCILHQQLPISNEELCALLFNLIDNAFEASEREQEPFIQLELRTVKNMLYMVIKNRASVDTLIMNPDLKTLKEDSENHGIGLSIVKDIVNRYDGSLEIAMEEDCFTVSIAI